MISKNQVKLIRQLEQKKFRQREGLFVAEGPKVVGDLLAAGFRPASLFATDEWQSDTLSGIQRVSPDELSRISFLQHPQQVLALFPFPDSQSLESVSISDLTLALDDVQDPGNLGTIIRIADWFGIHNIVCSPATADAWNPKVVQATMGSIARVNIFYTPLPAFISSCHLPVCGMVLDGDSIYTMQLPSPAIIVMGNEGNGISADVRRLLTHRLLIPRYSQGPDSLNVAIATAITCAEFRR